MTVEEMAELIEFQKQQISDLTAENARLRNESANSSEALMASNESNAELCEEVNNATESLEILGIEPWSPETAYAVDTRVQYRGGLYRCVQAHTSQEDWAPDITPALWTRMSLEEWPEWVQPTGVHDAYNTGDKVRHNGKHWVSEVDANVWEPGVYGWSEE